MRFKVAYLTDGARRTHLSGTFSFDEAVSQMNRLKRRGLTTWIEDEHGNFVPAPGAKRQPRFNTEEGSNMPRKQIQELIEELKSWLPNYDHGEKDYPTLFWRIMASLPGGDEAEDMGFEPFQLGWQEAEQLGRVLETIQDKRDVEELVRGLLADEEEVEEAPRVGEHSGEVRPGRRLPPKDFGRLPPAPSDPIIRWESSSGGTGLRGTGRKTGRTYLLRRAGGDRWNLHIEGKEYGPFPSLEHAKASAEWHENQGGRRAGEAPRRRRTPARRPSRSRR